MGWFVGQIGMSQSGPLIDGILTDWSGLDASSYATASFIRTSGEEFYVTVGSADLAHGQTAPSGLTQTGITWTYVTDITRAGDTLAVWSGVATTSGSSALTINFAGTQRSVTWSVTRVSNTTGLVQSVAAQGQPSPGAWLDVSLAALQPGSVVLLSTLSSSAPPSAARPGYAQFAVAQANSPNQKLVIYKGIPGVLPAGMQQPSGWLEDLLVIALELSV